MTIPLTIALMTYNRSAYLRESLEAILAQTYSDFEFLVMDNASTDDTCDVVKGYKDPRLIYVRQPPGGNSGQNWATSVHFARGEHIFVTHDDDIAEPSMVEKEMALLKANPKLIGVTTNVSLIDEAGHTIQPHLYPPGQDRIFKRGEYIGAYMQEKLWLPASTWIFRRDALVNLSGGRHKTPRMSKAMPAGDIWGACWVSTHGPIALLGEPLLRYRQHAGQDVRRIDHTNSLVDLYRILRKYSKDHPVFHRHAAAIEAGLIRFEAQARMLGSHQAADLKPLTRHILRMKERWEKMVPPRKRAMDNILPFDILLELLGLGTTLPGGKRALEELPPAMNSMQRGFRGWHQRLQGGGSLFHGPNPPRRIAILGSMLAAFLIALDARRQGIEVVCCLDSSPARQGLGVVGVPIVPFEWLHTESDRIDAIILSSEHGHEGVIRSQILRHLENNRVSITSWKDMGSTQDGLASAL